MEDHFTEPFEPYEGTDDAADTFDYGYDPEPETDKPGGQILWGRVAALGAGILIAFLLGRMTGGGDTGISKADLEAANAKADAAQVQIDDLQQQLDEAIAANETPDNSGDNSNSGDGSTEEKAQTYVVKSGDTLRLIAQDFYDDPELADLIADANGITDPTTLHVGQELKIPPKP